MLPGVQRVGVDPVLRLPVVELDGEEDVGGLRLGVPEDRCVFALPEVDVVVDDVGMAVGPRRYGDDTSAAGFA